jgi:hypothetical protein
VSSYDTISLLTTNSIQPRVQFVSWPSSMVPRAACCPECTSTCGLRCRFGKAASLWIAGFTSANRSLKG